MRFTISCPRKVRLLLKKERALLLRPLKKVEVAKKSINLWIVMRALAKMKRKWLCLPKSLQSSFKVRITLLVGPEEIALVGER